MNSNVQVKEKPFVDLPALVKVPRHVAIIMDGNRRWAKQRFLPACEGHRRGVDSLLRIINYATKVGVKVLTLYAFSTENWNRSKFEVKMLLDLLKISLCNERDSMIKNGVKLDFIGDLSPFPEELKLSLDEVKKATSQGDKLQLVLALNYGGRDDLKRAMMRIYDDIESGLIAKVDITEDLISKYLDTSLIGDPDLLIRSSGEKRMSNFLLWQISYTEIYLTDVLWPDFTEKDFHESILEYQKRDRRLGA
jgi:undecaprenyl diphosphate synthase